MGAIESYMHAVLAVHHSVKVSPIHHADPDSPWFLCHSYILCMRFNQVTAMGVSVLLQEERGSLVPQGRLYKRQGWRSLRSGRSSD